jgi:hypothetical protein
VGARIRIANPFQNDERISNLSGACHPGSEVETVNNLSTDVWVGVVFEHEAKSLELPLPSVLVSLKRERLLQKLVELLGSEFDEKILLRLARRLGKSNDALADVGKEDRGDSLRAPLFLTKHKNDGCPKDVARTFRLEIRKDNLCGVWQRRLAPNPTLILEDDGTGGDGVYECLHHGRAFEKPDHTRRNQLLGLWPGLHALEVSALDVPRFEFSAERVEDEGAAKLALVSVIACSQSGSLPCEVVILTGRNIVDLPKIGLADPQKREGVRI